MVKKPDFSLFVIHIAPDKSGFHITFYLFLHENMKKCVVGIH